MRLQIRGSHMKLMNFICLRMAMYGRPYAVGYAHIHFPICIWTIQFNQTVRHLNDAWTMYGIYFSINTKTIYYINIIYHRQKYIVEELGIANDSTTTSPLIPILWKTDVIFVSIRIEFDGNCHWSGPGIYQLRMGEKQQTQNEKKKKWKENGSHSDTENVVKKSNNNKKV